MKQLLLSLGLAFALVGGAAAQATPKGSKSDQTVVKIRQVDVMVQLIPLTLKKAQIDKLLPSIEKARAKELQIRKMEDDDLEKLDARLDDALKNGLEKQAYPPRELQVDVSKLTRAMAIRRQVALAEMIEEVYNATNTILDEGQRTVMEKSLNIGALDPSLKDKELTREQKIKFFIRQILLDSYAYDMLLKLQKTAP